MTAISANILNYQATDADHRAFAQGIHALLVGCGLTQTADTGQANLATILKPASQSISGYEIFRFNDAEQATLGCFIKVEYGQYANNSALRIQFGFSTNGAGVVSAATLLPVGVAAFDSAPDTAGSSRPAFASYAEGQFFLGFGLDAASSRGMVFYIGRPRAYDGARTTDGLIGVAYCFQSGSFRARVVAPARGSGPAALGVSALAFVPDALTAQDDQVGANVALWPMYVGVNANLRFGSLFGYRAAAIGVDAQQQIDVFGGLRNYRAMGSVMQTGVTSFLVPYF